MRKFQDSFETRKQSFITAFSICMTVPLKILQISQENTGGLLSKELFLKISQYSQGNTCVGVSF